jgi:hypothetical protein
LKRVRETGSVDFDLVRDDARFASLRNDPRFVALLT